MVNLPISKQDSILNMNNKKGNNMNAQKYWLTIFLGISAIALLTNYISSTQKIWDFFDALSSATAVALAVLAVMGYMMYKHSDDEIKIYFKEEEEEKEIDTGISLLRKHCTRSEVMGLLGMVSSVDRYNIKDLKDDLDILQQFNSIQSAQKNELTIKVTKEELKQFPALINKAN